MKLRIGKVLNYGEYNERFIKYGYLKDETTEKIHYFDECSLVQDEKNKIKYGILVSYEMNEEFNKITPGYKKDEAINVRFLKETENGSQNIKMNQNSVPINQLKQSKPKTVEENIRDSVRKSRRKKLSDKHFQEIFSLEEYNRITVNRKDYFKFEGEIYEISGALHYEHVCRGCSLSGKCGSDKIPECKNYETGQDFIFVKILSIEDLRECSETL